MRRRKTHRHLEPFREWKDANGDDVFGIHPLYMVIGEEYGGQVEDICCRLQEFLGGERKWTYRLTRRMLEIDELQQAKGAPDDDLVGLALLLRSRWSS